MARPSEKELEEGIATLARAATLVALVFVSGVVGYTLLAGPDYGVFDAVYMTVITLTTVGYDEAIDLDGNTPGRVFTVGLLLFGAGSFVYFISNLTVFMIEGHFDLLLWNRKMRKMISGLREHYIVCGAGDTGEHLIKELLETERPFVVIEEDEARIRELVEKYNREFAAVIGDATDDDVLREAGIERARALTAAIKNDKDNLLVVVSARLLNPKLRVVCRCIDEKLKDKVVKAGADAVVSPNMIGGLRMVSEMIRPTVVSFLDIMLRDENKGLRVEEFPVRPGTKYDGMKVSAFRSERIADVLLVAVKHGDDWTFNPDDDLVFDPTMSIIYMGNPAAREHLEDRA